ncbi:iron uptake transporter permease EfeU [Streptomyces sp. NPDC096046]|uniref:iron uptake transporter permease EfeU n=1 Tax=Streptomyces sp. NPDC096046 TaxID=3155542 RepID=UPI00331F155C
MWDDAFPSFLIGLREGLEAGLVVSVLVATLVRAGARSRLPQVWTGVLAAIALSMSFGAVLTFTAASLPTTAQEAFGGALSIVAVAFVTAMVFWMRRSARSLASELKGKVTEALTMGAGVLVLTSFLAVGREGLETALFLWTTARAAHESAGPLTGAGAGLVLAALLCWGLYRRVLRIDLTRFFTVTGAVLVVIAAGVLGYGLRDLQEGAVLPGGTAYAFDLSGSVDAGSWYGALLQGVLNLTPAMTWLQVAGYAGYLAVVMALFVRGGRGGRGGRGTPEDRSRGHVDASADRPTGPAPTRTRRLLPVAVVAVPALLAGLVVALADPEPDAGETVAVSETACGQGFTAPKPGRQDFRMHNTGTQTSEVYLIDPSSNAVYGEIEGLAPGTTRDLVATVAGGTYAWRCVPADGRAVTSKAVRVDGAARAHAVAPVSAQDLAAPLKAYKAYANRGLAALVTRTGRLSDDIRAGHLDTARADWLTAHRTYASLGAAYGTFEDFDRKIDGRPDGLPAGVHDKDFTGFHRIEYGLWHGESAAGLKDVAQRLADDAAGLRKAFPHQDFDPSDLPLRAHEILENTLQFELTGDTDQGSGTGLATAGADLAGTRELLTVLGPLLTSRAPKLLPTVDADSTRLRRLLDSGHHGAGWTPVDRLDPAVKARIDGAAGQLLEDLAPVPDLLEIRRSA